MSTVKSTYWSVTINNPTPDDEEAVNLARQKGWTVEGQKEVGKEGTPHYQLMVKTPQVRFSAIKKQFPRAHIEPARNASALQQYVHKDETRVAPLPIQSEMYPSLTKFWELIYERVEQFPRENYEGREGALAQFDDIVRELIVEGYHVETIAINPSTRSCWNRYAQAILWRAQTEIRARLDTAKTEVIENITLPTTNAIEAQGTSSPQGEEDDASSGSEVSDSEEFSESEYQEV